MEKPVSESGQWNAVLGRVALDRDRTAFRQLFAHFAPRIKAYLIRLGTAPQIAEDLAQEAMLSLWRKAHLFDPQKASVATWLFTIARNLRIDAIRKDRKPLFEADDPSLTQDDAAGADDGIAMAQNVDALRVALLALPPDQALIVQMSFFSDKPHSLIAAELGIPLGTVKSRLRLAMARLRTAMEQSP